MGYKYKKTEFNLFKEINSNFEVIESLTESNNIICGFVDHGTAPRL